MPIASNPSTTLYTLGKGIMSIAEYSTEDVLGDYSDVGNAPEFSLELSEETLEHYSSRSGAKRKDEEVTLQTGYTVNFILDEFSVANLARFVRGTFTGLQVLANVSLGTKFAIRFISDNPKGPDQTWNFHRMTLKPNGALSLISDEWSSMSFTGEGLDDSTNNPTSPYFTIDFVTTTTTTSTTSTTSTTAP